VGGVDNVPLLVGELSCPENIAEAGKLSLATLPGKAVDHAILDAMKAADQSTRLALIKVLCKRESVVAVPALLAEAGQADAARHGPAIEGLRSLASPKDVPELISLLSKTPKGKHRDEIEKTILLVCNNIEDPDKRAAPVLAVLTKADEEGKCLLLPVAGRLGSSDSYKTVEAAIKSGNPKLQDAGVRALCNWPDNSVADHLLAMVKQTQNKQHRTWALRAYVRVITLESKRPPTQTLAMLQDAMKLAQADPQRQLILQRAATVRTIETLRWVVPYLDDRALNQTACETIADLAHHRFLRTPNKEEFTKALKKVTKISKDPKVVERAQRYILGI
ncbi:MAG: hypothetical protein JXM70_19950, partial [Pirellulales bacterium]|nr:hypothetical protein [Pirellulales bacterium]